MQNCRYIFENQEEKIMNNSHAPISFDWKPETEKRELVHAISAVSSGTGVRVKSFNVEREKMIDQKITGG